MSWAKTAGVGFVQALRSLLGEFGRMAQTASSHPNSRKPVFAVATCHPTRILLFSAAFQAGWSIVFLRSLNDVLEMSRTLRPKAVLYDHMTADRTDWAQYCSAFTSQDIPFVLLAHKNNDETFLTSLAHGGYHAYINTLRSEEIVRAVELADEMVGLSHTAV